MLHHSFLVPPVRLRRGPTKDLFQLQLLRSASSLVQLGTATWLLAMLTIELALPHKSVYKVRHAL
jgi:hypothetical protein